MKPHLYKTIQKSSSILILLIFLFATTSTSAKRLVANSINNTTIKTQTTLIITKDTSLEELEDIKSTMKNEGFEFNYSNVVYNDKNEIISISISYKDKNNNNGNYSVASEAPISDITIIFDDNHVSVKSKGSGNQATINQGNSFKVSEDYQKTREEHRAAMEKRRDEMNKRMADRMQEMKERHSHRQARMEHQRDSLLGNQRTKSSESFGGSYTLISQNTTDAELLEIKKAYQSENIGFSYNQLERDTSNLITRISITINNGNGSRSTSSFGNGKSPIKNISIGVDSEHTIMKVVE